MMSTPCKELAETVADCLFCIFSLSFSCAAFVLAISY